MGAAGNRTAAAHIGGHGTGSAGPELQRLGKHLRSNDDADPGRQRKRQRLDDDGNWEPLGDLVTEVGQEPQEQEDDGVAELIQLFQQLSISFDSDVDGKDHEVYPSVVNDDLMVASNPTPLKLIMVQGHWLGVPLGAAAAQLRVLANTAHTQLTAYAKGRTHGNADALRLTMRQVGHLLKHLTANKINLDKTDLSASADHGRTGPKIVGSHVIADPLSVRSDTYGSAPGKAGTLMKAIKNQAIQSGGKSKNFKQMHLLNDNVFGPGEPWNLTPGTPKSNIRHEKDVETPLKRAIFEKGLVLRFEAIVDYRNNPATASDLAISQNPDLYRFNQIRFKAKEHVFDPITQTFTLQKSADPDVQAIDGYRLPWDWGGIKPLVPKPSILKCTDASELTAIGMGQAVARRIVAFNIAKPAFHPLNAPNTFPGTKKREALIALIARHDGKKQMPAKSFDATKVFWRV